MDPVKYLYSLAPAKVDQELRLLCVHDQDAIGLRLLKSLIELIFQGRHVMCNFDVVQSYVHRILTLHGSKLFASFEMRTVIANAQNITESAVQQLQLLVYTALCVLKTNLNIQLV